MFICMYVCVHMAITYNRKDTNTVSQHKQKKKKKNVRIKVTGYNFNFACAIINLYIKHWAVSAEKFGVSFRGVKTLCDRIYGLF